MAESVVVSIAANLLESNGPIVSNGRSDAAEDLSKSLTKLREFLIKVERQGRANSEELHDLYAEMRRIGYEAEDLVDTLEFNTECTAFSSLRHLKRAHRATKKLRAYNEEVKQMLSDLEKKYPATKEMSKKKPKTSNKKKHTYYQQTHQDLRDDDGFVVGIDNDVNKLWDALVERERRTLDVVAIVGMGGSGKTTLAKKLYYHQEMKNHFKFKAWVSLSQDWDTVEQLLESIMTQMIASSSSSSSSCAANKGRHSAFLPSSHSGVGDGKDGSFKGVERNLSDLLRTEPCLIVLDDVWNWKLLRKILKRLFLQSSPKTLSSSSSSSSSGSGVTKIIITSRQQPPPETHSRWICHEIKSLSEEDSWKLFKKKTRNSNGKKIDKEYRGLAKEMLKKCKGLPLAIVALGHLLKRKESIEEWERVFSQLRGEQGSHLSKPINDILALSYEDLPLNLKPCFLYLGLLAEEPTIAAGALKRMWIAEGFVKAKHGNITPEAKAKELLDELVNHTMVQVVTRTYADKPNTLRLHDMMRDLCIQIAQQQDFLTLCCSSDSPHQLHSRRAAINLSKCSGLPLDNANLRSLLLSGKSSTGKAYGRRMNNEQGIIDLALVFEKFKLLRVLNINGIKTYDGSMPKEIGNLIHLKYLGIRSTNIQKLPRSIGKLHKLLTLDYWDVCIDNEIRLPNEFWRLKRLRHLFLPDEMVSNTMADMRLDTLLDLQTLWGVKGGDWMLREMNLLSVNLTKLYIQGISTESQLKAVFDCNMIQSDDCGLSSLSLDWYGFSLEPESLAKLRSKKKLIKLRLMGRAALDKPQQLLPLEFPSNLMKLELYYTHLRDSETLNAIGDLPFLKFLGLSKDSFTGTRWIIRLDYKFPALEELKMSSLPELKQWEVQRGAMTCLKKLSIISCTNLKQMPRGLPRDTVVIVRRMPTTFNLKISDNVEEENYYDCFTNLSPSD